MQVKEYSVSALHHLLKSEGYFVYKKGRKRYNQILVHTCTYVITCKFPFFCTLMVWLGLFFFKSPSTGVQRLYFFFLHIFLHVYCFNLKKKKHLYIFAPWTPTRTLSRILWGLQGSPHALYCAASPVLNVLDLPLGSEECVYRAHSELAARNPNCTKFCVLKIYEDKKCEVTCRYISHTTYSFLMWSNYRLCYL
jgi:hypothetical protein